MNTQKSIVVKLGGSLLYDDQLNLNVDLLEKVKSWYLNVSKTYDAVVIVVGGGKLSRAVTEKVSRYLKTDSDRHGVAMELTQTNALVLKGFIGDEDIYCPETLDDSYEYLKKDGRRMMVSGGLKRGWSTDMDAAVFADVLGLKEVLKLSNVDHIYTSDPNKDPKAQPIEKMTWPEYRKLFGILDGDEHAPNAHAPISVECANFCESKGITFYVSGGKNLEKTDNLEEVFRTGTVISD